MKRPSFQFYPGDWLRDTGLRSCSVAARGLWIDALCLMHEGEPYGHLKVNHKVISKVNLARMIGATLQETEEWLKELQDAGVFSVADDGALISRRMVRDESLRQIRAAGGSKGGNPSLKHEPGTAPKSTAKVNHKVNPKVGRKVNHKDNQKPTPSSSSSSSTEDEDTHTREASPKRFKPPTLEEWTDYGQTLTPAFPETQCERTWHYYNSREWHTGQTPVKRWKSCLSQCWSTWKEESATPVTGRPNGHSAARKPVSSPGVGDDSDDGIGAVLSARLSPSRAKAATQRKANATDRSEEKDLLNLKDDGI